jgi:O-antigen/teichoic acid export membrane protein
METGSTKKTLLTGAAAVPETIEAKVAVGSAWSLASVGVTLVASLVATPFVLRGLGPEAYGVYSIVQVMIGYLAVADIGMGDASTRFAGAAFARGERQEEASVIWTSLMMEAIVALPLVLAVVVFAKPIVVHALQLPSDLQKAAAAALSIAAVGFLAKNAATVFNTPQMVRLRFRSVAVINTVCGVLQIGLVPVVIWLGGGLVGAVSVVASANALNLLLHFQQARLLLPEVTRPAPRRVLVRPMLRFGVALVVSAFVITLLTQTEKLFLARFDSARAVAFYAVAFTLATIVAIIPRAVKGALFPAFSQLEGSAVDRLYARAIRHLSLVVAPIAVAMCLIAEPFLRIWAGAEYARYSLWPFYVLLAGNAVGAIAHVPTVLLKGLGRADVIARLQILEVVPFLVTAALFTVWWGAIGAAAAWSLRTILDTGLLFRAASGYARVSVSPSPRERIGIASGAVLLGAPLLLFALPNLSIPIRVTAVGITLIAYCVVAWMSVLTVGERSRLVALAETFTWRRAANSRLGV